MCSSGKDIKQRKQKSNNLRQRIGKEGGWERSGTKTKKAGEGDKGLSADDKQRRGGAKEEEKDMETGNGITLGEASIKKRSR